MIKLLLLLCFAAIPLQADSRSEKDSQRIAGELRASLKSLAPHLQVGWEVPLKDTVVRNLWLNKHDVLVETQKFRLWAFVRKSGDSRFVFAQRIGSSRRTFRIETRPVRSANQLYLIGKGYLFVLDDYGNLERYGQLGFSPASEPAATDGHLLIGTHERFFYGYNQKSLQYDRRVRLEGPAPVRPVVSADRVYFAANNPGKMRISALDLNTGKFFRTIWSRRVYDRISAPLSVHPHAGQLYAAGENGTLFCLSKHSGEILWSHEAGGAIRQMPVGHRDRVFVVAEEGEKPGLHCVKAIDAKGGSENTLLWRYAAAKQLLAIGKQRLYVRSTRNGKPSIATLRISDGRLLANQRIDSRFTLFRTNLHGAQIILGTRDGFIFELRELE